MPFTTVTVTAQYGASEPTPESGKVTFTRSEVINDPTTGLIVAPVPVVAELDATGSIAVPLLANNDPTTTPIGSTYEVLEQIDGAPERSYTIVVPYTAPGGTVSLVALGAAIPLASTNLQSLIGLLAPGLAQATTDAATLAASSDPLAPIMLRVVQDLAACAQGLSDVLVAVGLAPAAA